ncbi:MAG: hydroxymethylpyrimidine/phosphomethylpyrimidine kinase [Deltaproteobacteria bacterium]|nr:hydroxymethylpyrimidine/phosphomethylpyrimidine kinase [Deltaproteobacteria bacterium]
MSKAELSRPCALSIAGLDPSAGAGLLADLKTFESQGVFGLGVCSALTFQNDISFSGLQWVSKECLLEQLQPLFERFEISCVKIGIIENLATLRVLVSFLRGRIPNVPIIWDPVARASAGFAFHASFEPTALQEVLDEITLITPNPEEQALISSVGTASLLRTCACAVLRKSLYARPGVIVDALRCGESEIEIEGVELSSAQKHGSGCVLSAAICAAVAKGETLVEACHTARKYSERYLTSSNNLIGYHSAYA